MGKGEQCVGTAGISRSMGHDEGLPVPTRHHKLAVIVASIYEQLDEGIDISEVANRAAVSLSTLRALV